MIKAIENFMNIPSILIKLYGLLLIICGICMYGKSSVGEARFIIEKLNKPT